MNPHIKARLRAARRFNHPPAEPELLLLGWDLGRDMGAALLMRVNGDGSWTVLAERVYRVEDEEAWV